VTKKKSFITLTPGSVREANDVRRQVVDARRRIWRVREVLCHKKLFYSSLTENKLDCLALTSFFPACLLYKKELLYTINQF
jgi:hypothetical protein